MNVNQTHYQPLGAQSVWAQHLTWTPTLAKYVSFACLIVVVAGATVNDTLAGQDRTVDDENLTGVRSPNSEFPIVEEVETQPLLASISRLEQAMDYIGSPLPESVISKLSSLSTTDDASHVSQRVQSILDPYCLVGLTLQDDGPPHVVLGEAKRELIEQGWRTFLVKVVNPPGKMRRLLIASPNARPLPHSPANQVASRWMQLSTFEGQPLRPNLSGLELEYRIVQLYSSDPGTKQALLEFSVGGEPGEDGEVIHEWRFTDGTDGWEEMNQCELTVRDGSLHVTSTGRDPYMGADVDTQRGRMVLRFWAKTDADGRGQLFWSTSDRPRADGRLQTTFNLATGREHLYEVPFNTDEGRTRIRLDPMVRPGEMRIDWIQLCSAQSASNQARLAMEFDCNQANRVTFRVKDEDGNPCVAKFTIRDSDGVIFPSQSKRLAPDFFFQRQIYRGDGETVSLPAGEYTIECSRGPETIPETVTLQVADEPVELAYQVRRWIDPSDQLWWSGDHHIHAAGCQHYQNPTQGVHPEDMLRHIMGEDLKIGCCLTWGPCFDFQKRFFTGAVAEESVYPYLLRYDVEVSGFGSHRSGHLNLLNLTDQIFPGGDSKDHWPTLGLNTLRWAQRQGAVCGPAHSASGLTNLIGRLPDTDGKDGPNGLPNFNLPAYDGIGANEFVMNVTHQVPGPDGELVPAIDFISAMNTSRTAEWNMWYHVLNCGFRVAVSGETDFPCISGERVGIGRVYAQVEGELSFSKWVQSIADGRSYVSDGSCHLMDFTASAGDDSDVKPVQVGHDGSELSIAETQSIQLSVTAAARLARAPMIPVELVVNGYPVEQQFIRADGEMRELDFETEINTSSWVAIRVFPNAHTNPIRVIVAGKPIRASAESARWCLSGVEQCWTVKQRTYHADEQADARAAFDHARAVYRRIIDECIDAE